MSETAEAKIITNEILTVWIKEQVLGIPVIKIQDVFSHQKHTPVPLTPPEVEGVINLRGHIVTSLSLARKLKLEADAENNDKMNIAVEHKGNMYSLEVDRVGDVITMNRHEFDHSSHLLEGELKEYASGVFKLESGLMPILDIEKILNACC